MIWQNVGKTHLTRVAKRGEEGEGWMGSSPVDAWPS